MTIDRFGENQPTIDTPEGEATLDQCFRQPQPLGTVPTLCFVNAYAVTRRYGGPEEGGWWYSVGEPLASVPVVQDWTPDPAPSFPPPQIIRDDATERRIKIASDILHAAFDHLYSDHEHDRYSSACDGDDLYITVEDAIATAYPTERPHYE